MDQLTQERRDEIIDALQRGTLPKLLPSHRYALRLTGGRYGRYITLVDGQGPTPEGEFVYHTLGLDVPTDLQFDQFTEPIKRVATNTSRNSTVRRRESDISAQTAGTGKTRLQEINGPSPNELK